MATISVLSYSLPHGLKMKPNNSSNNNNSSTNNKMFNKIIVDNVLTENNGNSLNITKCNANTIVKKIKDFGMIGSVNSSGIGTSCTAGGLIRKRVQKILPLGETKTNAANAKETPSKKLKIIQALTSVPENTVQHGNKPAPFVSGNPPPGRKGLPAPQAVARRNARERNRVKQVNNGFAALRERIPEEVAAAFEAQGNGRGSVKKLSKVETLRMAVEYIRNLEKMLGFDFPKGSSDANSNFSLIKDECGSNSPSNLDDNYCDDSMSNFDTEDENVQPHTLDQDELKQPPQLFSSLIDSLPNITTLNGLQYIRIPGTNTYQLLSANFFTPKNDDQFHALIENSCVSPVATIEGDTSYNEEDLLATAATPAISYGSSNSSNTSNKNNYSHRDSPSPVPQSLSPSTALRIPSSSPVTHQQLSPVGNEFLLQTCGSNNNTNSNTSINEQFIQQQFQPRIKIEKIENVIVGNTTIIYDHPQHSHVLLGNTSISVSPPLERGNISTSAIQGYFDDHSSPFYEDVVTFKKEINDVILDTSTATGTAAMSDESMMDAIDWWDAHTPKSDGGSVIL